MSLIVNKNKINADLEENWIIISEAIQTILRRESYPNPYEALKSLTRVNSDITKEVIHDFIDKLDVKANIKIDRKLFSEDAKPTTCKLCHGSKGNSNGSLARSMEKVPRNSTCEPVTQDLPDGQLFWVIKYGSKGTALPAHLFSLGKEQIWQLILYIRRFLET